MKDDEQLKQYLKHMNFDTLKTMCESRKQDEKELRELLKSDRQPSAKNDYPGIKSFLFYLVLYGLLFWFLMHAIYKKTG
jgi:hypothetical protein